MVRRSRDVNARDRIMAGGIGVVEAGIIVGDVVVNVDDTDVLVVLSLVSHDSLVLLALVF